MTSINKEIFYAHPPALVWRAVATSEAIAQWLTRNDFEPVAGHKFEMHTDPAPGFDGIIRCEVLEIDEPNKLSYSWKGGPIDTVVTFELSPQEGGTLLRFEHSGFEGIKGRLVATMLKGGWGSMLDTKIPAVLDGFAAESPA